MKKIFIILCIVVLTAPKIQGNCKDAQQICEELGNTGSIAYDCDTTCSKFIICYTAGGILQGLIKMCPSEQYFDNSLRICSSQKPIYCE